MEKTDLIKVRVQRVILLISVGLLVGKFVAYFITNSVGIFTDAMESIVNVTAGIITLWSLRLAAKPKDEGHPYGHGKVELISASIEGILIGVAGGIIIYEGIRRLFEPAQIQSLDTGIVIVAVAGLVNYLAGWYSIRVGKKHDSIALIAGGKHLQSDTYSSIGLVVGLILLYITKIHWIDSVIALIFGSLIIYTGVNILRKTVANLMDKSDRETIKTLVDTIAAHRRDDWVDIHNTRIIKYGKYFHIDCDLTVPYYYNIRQGHKTYEALKKLISDKFSGNVFLSVHLDPCKEEQCPQCLVKECPHRSKPFESELVFDVHNLVHYH